MVASYPFDSGTEKPRGWDAKGIYSEGKISNEHLLLPKWARGIITGLFSCVITKAAESYLTR